MSWIGISLQLWNILGCMCSRCCRCYFCCTKHPITTTTFVPSIFIFPLLLFLFGSPSNCILRSISCVHSKTFVVMRCIVSLQLYHTVHKSFHSLYPIYRCNRMFFTLSTDLKSECNSKCTLQKSTRMKQVVSTIYFRKSIFRMFFETFYVVRI